MQVQNGFPVTRASFVRTLHKGLNICLPILGVVIILSAVLFVHGIREQLAIVVVGILFIEAGVWKLARQFLPNERKHLALRAEGDRFIVLIRHLNAAALAVKESNTPENLQAFEEVQTEMHRAVQRMAEVAGKTDDELATEQKVAV
jgi:hypothetical protein